MSPIVAGGYTDVQILAEDPEEPGVYRVGHGAGDIPFISGCLIQDLISVIFNAFYILPLLSLAAMLTSV